MAPVQMAGPTPSPPRSEFAVRRSGYSPIMTLKIDIVTAVDHGIAEIPAPNNQPRRPCPRQQCHTSAIAKAQSDAAGQEEIQPGVGDCLGDVNETVWLLSKSNRSQCRKACDQSPEPNPSRRRAVEPPLTARAGRKVTAN